jgi:hypothetical protein
MLGMRRDIAHDRGDLHHLHRMGQPMVREPQRRKAGVARRPHLLDDLRNALRDIEALGELRVDEQTHFHHDT